MRVVRETVGVTCVAVLALLAGCGGPGGAAADAGAPPVDAGTELVDSGTPDAGAPCEGSTLPCAVAWTESAVFPTRVDHHTAFAHTSQAGAYLYVAGGVLATNEAVSQVFDTVRRAKVNDDGSLGAWEDLSALPRPIGFHGMTVSGDRVYLVAGVTKDSAGIRTNRATLVGDFDADGKLSWRVGPDLPESFLHPSVQLLGSRLYLLGGSGTMMDPKDKVYVTSVDASGMTGAWSAGPVLPEPRSHHVTVVRDGRIYAVGGFRTGQTPIEEILRSVHDAQGAITGWELGGLMLNAPWTAAGFVNGDWLYVVGGGEGGPGQEQYTGRVRRGRFDPDGLIRSFEDVQAPLPLARAHVHHTPVVNGRVYSVGGRDSTFSSVDRVFIGALGAP